MLVISNLLITHLLIREELLSLLNDFLGYTEKLLI